MAKTRCLSCLQMIETDICPHCGYPASTRNGSHHLPVGTLLRGRYQLGQVLGQGGFGITYLALDTLMKTTVAVKEFFPSGTVFRDCSNSTLVNCVTNDVIPHFEYSRERFLREARALVQFKDIPEIVDILDFVEENNTAYIVMEFIRGVDLAKYVQNKGGKLSVDETFRILRPVMEALAAVHKGGIVHRDISPDNIVLDPLGGAKLLDFGAVRRVENPDLNKDLEKSTEAIIKRGFAPVEQYNTRGSLGPWTDEYAMCASIWFCLTGTLPPEATLRVSEGLDLDWSSIPGLPRHQQMALKKGFSLLAKDRYPDMDSFLEALFGEDVPETVKEEPVRAAAETKPKKKKGKTFLLIGVAVLLVLAAVVGALFSRPKSPTQEELYTQAGQLEAEGHYLEAAEAFEALGYFQDSTRRAEECRYAYAEFLMGENRYEEALAVYDALEGYKDSEKKVILCQTILTYAQAETLMALGEYEEAAAFYASLGDYLDSREKAELCANTHTYLTADAMLENGQYYEAATTFYALGDFQDSRDRCFAAWRYITPYRTTQMLSVTSGSRHAVGLMDDGTVKALYREGFYDFDQWAVDGWRDIVAVCSNLFFTVGLKADGTVLATGDNTHTQCNVEGWTDIIAISVGDTHTVGLKADGTVVTAGAYRHGQYEVLGWTDIVAICAAPYGTVGLKADGTVVIADKYYSDKAGLASWREIVSIAAGQGFTLGLKADGTVLFSGSDYAGIYTYEWKDIVAVSASTSYALGLKADGTVIYTGPNLSGEQAVTGWTDIVAIHAEDDRAYGIRADGTVVAVGKNEEGQCDVSGWTDIRMPAYMPPGSG